MNTNLKRVRRVGVRFPSWISFHTGLFKGILNYMRLHEMWQLELPQDTDDEMERVVIDKNWDGDGLLLFRYTPEEAEAFQRRGVCVVNLSAECADGPFPSVLPDNVRAGREAARHLLALGLQKFAFLGRRGDVVRRYSLERAEGFCKEIEAAGREVSVTQLKFVRDGRDRLDTVAFNREIVAALQSLPAGTGIFAADDLLAANVLRVCRSMGLVVPGHFAVIGFNNEELFCHTTLPPLSSVSYPGEAIGFRAAEILGRLFAGEKMPGHEWRISVMGYAERESTNILAVTAPRVADAVRIIRNRAPTYPLRVNELLEQLDVSYSGLNKLFSAALNTTPKQEINRVRLETFRRLLATTDWTTERIADHMHFESAEDARRFFRRESGVSASDFRREHQVLGPLQATRKVRRPGAESA